MDRLGRVIYQTARQVRVGDQFIASDDSHYRVKRVDGDVASCDLLTRGPEEEIDPTVGMPVAAAPGTRSGKPAIGIYHTHGDESYQPSQGTYAIPEGKGSGVDLVSRELTNKLNSLGIKTIYDDASNLPHDLDAYARSRETAFYLMRQGVSCLIDVHRDGAPISNYLTRIGGLDVARITLVVGMGNPNQSAALGFAREIKHQLDGIYPGLIKGIYLADGVFNQDLTPASLLVEIGSQENTLGEAEAAASLFGDVMPRVFEVSPITGVTRLKSGADQGGSWKALLLVLAVLVAGGFGFLLISAGSWDAAVERIKTFGSRELGDLWGRRGDILDAVDSRLETGREKVRAGLSQAVAFAKDVIDRVGNRNRLR